MIAANNEANIQMNTKTSFEATKLQEELLEPCSKNFRIVCFSPVQRSLQNYCT